jgi:uncharacterized protein (TIGR02118 family)
MIKALVFLQRRPGLSPKGFRRYWHDVHGPLAASMPGVRRYVQNHVNELPGILRDGSYAELPCDGVAELWFDSLDALQAAFASPNGRACLADNANFVDNERTVLVAVDEVVFESSQA